MVDIGVYGEDTFQALCSSAGLIANSSLVDKTGWDFLVEFPYSSPNNLPLDMQVSPIECKVQVKSTIGQTKKVQFKLSTLQRLASEQLPCFFFFIEFDSDISPKAGYLVHFDKELIKKVLIRLRKLEVQGNKRELNKKKFTIKYDTTHKLKTLNGENLKNKIIQYIPSGMENYVKQKSDYIKSIGFEDGYAHFNIITKSEQELKSLVDVTLGLKDKVQIERFWGNHYRFGIKSPVPFIEMESAFLEIKNQQPATIGKIIFKQSPLEAGLTFNCSLYNSPLNRTLPKQYVKFRIKGDFFELISEVFTGNSTYSIFFEDELKMDISTLYDAIKLLSWMSIVGKELLIELEFQGIPHIKSKITIKDSTGNWERTLSCVENFKYLCTFFKIENYVKVGLNDIMRYEININELHKALTTPASEINIKFKVDEHELDLQKKVACLFFFTSTIGNYFAGVLFVVIGFPKKMDDSYILQPEYINHDLKSVHRNDKEFNKDHFIQEVQKIEQRYSKKGILSIRMFK